MCVCQLSVLYVIVALLSSTYQCYHFNFVRQLSWGLSACRCKRVQFFVQLCLVNVYIWFRDGCASMVCRVRIWSMPSCRRCRVVSVVAARSLQSMHLSCLSATMPSRPSSSSICHWRHWAKSCVAVSCSPVMCRLSDLLSLTSRSLSQSFICFSRKIEWNVYAYSKVCDSWFRILASLDVVGSFNLNLK